MDQPDWPQLQKALADNPSAGLAGLYDAVAGNLYRFVLRLSNHSGEAEDVVQEVFMTVARMHTQIGQVRNLKGYLYTTARNALRRQARNRQTALVLQIPQHSLTAAQPATGESGSPPIPPTLLSREPEAATGILTAERNRQIETALQRLPEEQRDVVALKLDGGFTFEEIGKELGIPAQTAASRYRYALEALRRSLEDFQYDRS